MLQLNQVKIASRRQRQCLIELEQLNIAAGQVATIMGPSGSGKSTLLRWVLGEPMENFSISGEIVLNQHVISELPIHKRQIGLMYQGGELFPHLSVAENLQFALPRGLNKTEQRQRISQALAEVKLTTKQDARPQQLSGGEQSRIALIRSLLAEPKAMLLDEPFSALDTELRHEIREFTFNLLAERQIPALLVTHDQADIGEGPVINLVNGSAEHGKENSREVGDD